MLRGVSLGNADAHADLEKARLAMLDVAASLRRLYMSGLVED